MQIFTGLLTLLITSTITALTTDTLFCVANYQHSVVQNTTENMPCTMFFEQVQDACDIYVNISKVPNSLNHCFSSNLRSSIDEYVPEFISFIQNHRKEYVDIKEIIERFYIFKENMMFAFSENAKGHSYFLGANKFADLTNIEYQDTYLSNYQRPKNYCTKKSLSGTFPNEIDWVNKKSVTTVKNQGSCGSCWSFSAIGAIEGLYAIQNNPLTDFSEQQLVSCSSAYGNMACNGGLMQNAFSYVVDYGISTLSSYPYTSGTTKQTGTCQPFTSVYKIKGCYNVPTNEQQLTMWLSKQPVSISIDASSQSFQLYKSGIYDDVNCYKELNHGVLAVGFGSIGSKDYYRVKNSWGDWGDQGYINIARNSVTSSTQGICGICLDASLPF